MRDRYSCTFFTEKPVLSASSCTVGSRSSACCKVLFAETSEVMPAPEMLKEYLEAMKRKGIFDNINGIIVGKPMNEMYYEEYKNVWRSVVDNAELPILYNVNFGHSAPRAILPYGAMAHVDAEKQEITLL